MEETLRHHLSTCAAAYCAATGSTTAAIGQSALNDNTFFRRVVEGGRGFTIKTYDRVMFWLDENWPAGTRWPRGVPRPASTEGRAA